jgi:hypothetical protein
MPVKVVSLRALHRDPPTDVMVAVTREGEVVGTFVPVAFATPEALDRQLAAAEILRRPSRVVVHEDTVSADPDAGSAAVPTKGASRKAAQASRDAILRRVNKGGS